LAFSGVGTDGLRRHLRDNAGGWLRSYWCSCRTAILGSNLTRGGQHQAEATRNECWKHGFLQSTPQAAPGLLSLSILAIPYEQQATELQQIATVRDN
jgi:hypothetical protein